ncbi:MAG: efflux RND transporter permease subunit [bacterium]
MKILRWILHHPVSIIILVFLIVLIGINSFLYTPIEIQPASRGRIVREKEQTIRISVTWSKQPPEILQQMITMPLEEKCMQLKDISAVNSSTGKGVAYLDLSFPADIKLQYIYLSVKEKIAQIKKQENFPSDAVINVEPFFGEDEEEQQQQYTAPFFEFQINGPQTLNQLRHLAKEQILPLIKSVDGTGTCEVLGGSDGFLQIKLNQSLMNKYSISQNEIQRYLSQAKYYKGLGAITSKGENHLLMVDNRPESIDELRNISVKKGITLGEISTISFRYKKPESISRRNFLPLISINVFKIPGKNALKFSEQMKNKIKEIRNVLPEGTELIMISDQAQDLRAELNSLWIRTGVILTVVFIILFLLFRKFFPSFMILLIILLSFCSAGIFLYLSGYTINIVTLAGIALVFGMLVDNAVVVVENIQHYYRLGKPPYISALRGTLEIFQPLLASSATTILVFFSLLLLKERLGEYYSPMALVLGFSLIASLLLAVVLMPAIFIRFPEKFKPPVAHHEKPKKTSYASVLEKILRFPLLTMLTALFIFGITIYLFIENVSESSFFYHRKKLQTRVSIRAPKGVTLQTLDNIAGSFEQIIDQSNINCETLTTINEKSAYASIRINYPEKYSQSYEPYILENKLIGQAVNYAGIGIYIGGVLPESYYNGGYRIYTHYGSRLQITGPDYYKLWDICRDILKKAKTNPRVDKGIVTPSERNIWGMETSEHNFQYECDVQNVWQKGLNVQSIRYALYQLFPGSSWEDEIIIGNQRYPLRVTFQDKLTELDEITRSPLTISGENTVYFNDCFRQVPEKQIHWIDKKNQQYKFTIAWNFKGPSKLQQRYLKSIIESVILPPGYNIEESDWSFFTEKEKMQLKNLIIAAAVGVFMILAALYESFWKPFVIFLSVPFAMLGVFLMYVIFGRDFSVNAYIGIILLLGIVVNDSIVLVERINQVFRKKKNLKESLIQAGTERIRPIIITTVTTIGGLIPIFFLSSRNTNLSEILEELSFIMVGGMISSTIFTISLIPVFYYFIYRLRMFTSKLIQQ